LFETPTPAAPPPPTATTQALETPKTVVHVPTVVYLRITSPFDAVVDVGVLQTLE
jgi:hypothetical protein